MIPLGMIFSIIVVFMMNAVNGEEKEREGVEREATLNQRGSRSFPDTFHVGLKKFI